MRTQTYTVTAGRRVINIHSTNQLVMNGDVDVQAGKTGFITKVGLLPRHASASAAGRAPGRRCRPRRQVERRTLLGNAAPVQLVRQQGRGSARLAAPGTRQQLPLNPRGLRPTSLRTLRGLKPTVEAWPDPSWSFGYEE